MNLVSTGSIRVIKFHKDFMAYGWDRKKVSKGIEDLTSIKEVDRSRKWNGDFPACRLFPYDRYAKEGLVDSFIGMAGLEEIE